MILGDVTQRTENVSVMVERYLTGLYQDLGQILYADSQQTTF